MLSTEAKKSILVGAESLTENEYNVISNLIFSPTIQYYDKENYKWKGLLLDDNEISKDTSLAKQSIEFKFLLSTPQIQL